MCKQCVSDLSLHDCIYIYVYNAYILVFVSNLGSHCVRQLFRWRFVFVATDPRRIGMIQIEGFGVSQAKVSAGDLFR